MTSTPEHARASRVAAGAGVRTRGKMPDAFIGREGLSVLGRIALWFGFAGGFAGVTVGVASTALAVWVTGWASFATRAHVRRGSEP
jgi:hypothetical protein